MIERMQGIAKRIYPVRLWFIVIAFLCLFAFLYIVLSGEPRLDAYLYPSVISFAWSLCLFGMADTFYRVPEKVAAGDRFWLRIIKRTRRFIAWLWSVGFLVCTMLLFYLSYKAFNLALAA